MHQDFRFLVLKNPKTGLIFVSLDSVVGYLKTLSYDLERLSEQSNGEVMPSVIGKAVEIIAERLESMEDM